MSTKKAILKTALIQAKLHWEDSDANLAMFGNMIAGLDRDVDLILLPETFSTGFSMRAAALSATAGRCLDWMCDMAVRAGTTLAGSMICSEGGSFYNRFYWVGPDGHIFHYDKRHLFSMGREDEHFSRGRQRMVFDLGGFRLLPQICYDLRFPVFARNRGDYDAICYVANWPAARMYVWETLLKARAMENQAWVMAVNRCGYDGMGVDHSGGSCVIDPLGQVVEVLDDRPGVLISSINLEMPEKYRKSFPVQKDADNFELRI